LKASESNNKHADKFFKKLFDYAPIGMYVEQDKRFQLVNTSFQKLTGFSEDELIGMDSLKYVFPEDRNLVRENALQMLKGSLPSPFEFRVILKSGEVRWIVETVTSIKYHKRRALLGYYMDITERKRAEEALKASHDQLRNLSIYLQTVREEERTRIAREIHDELGQVLTALKMDLSWLGNRLSKDQQSLFEKTKSMSELIDMTIQTIKKISSELRPSLLDDLGLAAAIEWQTEEFQKRTGIECKVALNSEDTVLNPDLSTTIFRIFQETLTNIARHANATKVKAGLKENAGKIILGVKDNGKGITRKQISDHKSLGLIGIRERARFWGGKVKISGIRDKGTTVTVSIPLDKAGEVR